MCRSIESPTRPPTAADVRGLSRYRLNSSPGEASAARTLMSKRCCRAQHLLFISRGEAKHRPPLLRYACCWLLLLLLYPRITCQHTGTYTHTPPGCPRAPAILHFRFVKCYKVGCSLESPRPLSRFPVCDLLLIRAAQSPARGKVSRFPYRLLVS